MTVLRQTFSIFQRSLSSFPRASHGVPSHPICRPLTAHVSRTRTRAFSSSLGRLQDKVLPHFDSSPSTPDAPVAASLAASPEPRTQVKFEAPEPRLSLAFTCAVEGCSTRSTHQFTKRSYERGIVIVQCPGCKNRHLIADHLGWFKESTEDGKLKTVEDLMRAKGEKVRRGRIDAGGVVEYAPE